MADIVLKDREGGNVTYSGVKAIKVYNTGGGEEIFHHGELIEETVDPDFSAGDIVLTPGDDAFYTQVTVKKPSNLRPEIIKKDEVIAGIVGTLEGGSAGAFDYTDEYLQYFGYTIDFENKTITLCRVFYDVIYEKTGSYDVTVPDQIGGFDVIISAE